MQFDVARPLTLREFDWQAIQNGAPTATGISFSAFATEYSEPRCLNALKAHFGAIDAYIMNDCGFSESLTLNL